MAQLYVSKWNGLTVVALIEKGKMMALDVCLEEEISSIYKGIVKAKKENLNAYFINIGKERDVFLHQSNCLEATKLNVGESVIVQTTRVNSRYKSGQVTMHVKLIGKFIIYSPYSNYVAVSKKLTASERKMWHQFGSEVKCDKEGIIFRTAVKTASKAEIEKELYQLRDKLKKIIEKSQHIQAPALLQKGNDCIHQTLNKYASSSTPAIITDRKDIYERLTNDGQIEVITKNTFPFNLEKEIQLAMKKIVWMQDGSYLLVEENESLTVIDVNSGYSSVDFFTINQNAAREAIRQLRIRNIGGMIVIDFLRMNDDERVHIQKIVEDAAKQDVHTVSIFGFTRMGLFELTRKKIGHSLKEIKLL